MDGTKGTTGRGVFAFTFHLEPREGETEVRLVAEIDGLTGLMGLMSRLFVGMYRKGSYYLQGGANQVRRGARDLRGADRTVS